MKVKDIIDQFIAGDWGEETCSNETPCAVTCVRGADIIPISEYNFSAIPIRYITQQSYLKNRLQVGDIIIEKSGGSPTQSTGRVSFVSQELLDSVGSVVCSNFCTAFRVKKGWNPLYVYYYFQFIYNLGLFFNFEGKTSGLKNLQLDAAFAAIPIDDVSESTQNKIVAVLQGLEKKIALNRQINQNLEAMAKQLYDYWFVQFDFPDEDGKPYKSSGGKMIWNEKLKKMIPKEWTNANIYQLANISKESVNPQAQPNDLFKHYSLPEYDKTRTHAEEYGADIQSAKFVVTNDCILVSKLNPWTSRVICGNKESNQICSTEFVVWKPISMRTKGFLFMLAKSAKFIEYCTQGATGTSHSHRRINPELMMKYEFPYNSEIAMKFSIFIENIIEQLHTNITQLKVLTKQRNELLPLLINGQVSVNSDLAVFIYYIGLNIRIYEREHHSGNSCENAA